MLDKTWHLAASTHEQALTTFEFAASRLLQAFQRWQVAGMQCVVDLDLAAADLSILHVIRMQDRPKALSELARLLNRDDIANVQYSLRKLTGAGLITSRRNASRKVHLYQVTPEGRRITDAYAAVRRDILTTFSQALKDADHELGHAALIIEMMAGVYDQSARVANTCTLRQGQGDPEAAGDAAGGPSPGESDGEDSRP